MLKTILNLVCMAYKVDLTIENRAKGDSSSKVNSLLATRRTAIGEMQLYYGSIWSTW